MASSATASAAEASTAASSSSAGSTSRARDDPFPRETGFYGTRIDYFADDVMNAVDDYLCEGMDALEKALVKDSGLSEHKLQLATVFCLAKRRVQTGY